MDIKDLKPAPYNPRVMKDRAKKGLRRSLATFGDLSGIVFNKTSGNLVTGHNRMEELQGLYGDDLKLRAIKGHFVLEAPTGDRFPVRVVEWDKGKEMAANVTANNTGIQGRFSDGLQPLLWKIKDSLSTTFSELRLDDLVKHAKSKVIEGTEEFSEVLGECNNYVVLVFRNTVDWLNALTHFQLETKTAQRRNGKAWSKGVGRVLDGAVYIHKQTSEG